MYRWKSDPLRAVGDCSGILGAKDVHALEKQHAECVSEEFFSVLKIRGDRVP